MSQLVLFNYGALDSDTSAYIQQQTNEIKTLVRRSAQDIVEIGLRLIDVKARLGHGRFGTWLQAEFGWTDRTARQMMAVAETFKSENFSDLNIAPSALYLLASPSTPDEVRQEALERAEAGESITHSVARQLVDEHKDNIRNGTTYTMNTANIGQRLYQETRDAALADPQIRAFYDEHEDENGEEEDAPRQYDGESPAWCKYCYTTHDKWSIAADCIVPGWECGLCGHVTADEWMEVYSTEQSAPVSESAETGDGEIPVQSETEAPASTPKPHVAHNAGNNEWYTPPEYIAAAYEVMGGIDLDPATTPKANEVVGATRIYTADDDGLLYSWQGRVWMNPPYASELVGKFAAKLAQHVRAGEVTDAIVLVNNATETGWFNTLVSVASAVVFPRGRVRFWEPNGAVSAPLQGQAVLYIGQNPGSFLDAYREFGWGAML